MRFRTLLVAMISLATIGFVVGTSIERHNARHESSAQLKAEGTTSTDPGGGETPAEHGAEGAKTTTSPSPESGGESPASHAAKGASSPVAMETHKELRPLGINVEAVPFIILAAFASLALAAGAWLRPRWVGMLVVLALAMLIFGVLDIREVAHQSDESQTGLGVLAGAIAALHLAAAVVAGRMAQGARGLPG